MSTGSLKAVFLDVDATLVDYEFAARAALADAIGSTDGWSIWDGYGYYDRFLNGELDFEGYRYTRMRDFLGTLGRHDDAERAEAFEVARFEALERYYALFDDVLPFLQILRERGLQIGLITNNESVYQRRKIAIVGLDELVDSVSISEEVGAPKPDARIFEHACAQLGVAPGEAVHIGDNGPADVDGAVAHGIRAVWLDRPEAAERLVPVSSPYDTVTSLAEVAELL